MIHQNNLGFRQEESFILKQLLHIDVVIVRRFLETVGGMAGIRESVKFLCKETSLDQLIYLTISLVVKKTWWKVTFQMRFRKNKVKFVCTNIFIL